MQNWECPAAVDELALKQAIDRAIDEAEGMLTRGQFTSAYVIVESFMLYALPSLQPLLHKGLFLALPQHTCFKRRYASWRQIAI